MSITVLLVRHGATDWTAQGRVHGRRDVGLDAEGIEQARALGLSLRGMAVAEAIASPLQRTVQTAEILAGFLGVGVARDARLQELDAGRWEGGLHAELATTQEYKEFLSGAPDARAPGGESLVQLRDRALASLRQALEDNGDGATLLVVTHSNVIRVLVAHYLSAEPGSFHRLRVSPGSVTALRFLDDRQPPRLLALNHGVALDRLLGR